MPERRRVEILAGLLDIVLRLDVHLAPWSRIYGAWVYAILFAVIFAETGLVVTPFLPGTRSCSWRGRSPRSAGWTCTCSWPRSRPRHPRQHHQLLDRGAWPLGAPFFDGGRSRWVKREAPRAKRTRSTSAYGGAAVVHSRFLPHHPHLRPLRGGPRGDGRGPLHRLQRGRRRAVGRLARLRAATSSATCRGCARTCPSSSSHHRGEPAAARRGGVEGARGAGRA